MRAVLVGLVGAVLAVGSAGADPLAGVYRGSGGDPDSGLKWDLYAKVLVAAPGQYKVNIQSTNATCASTVDGNGVVAGRVLRVSGDCLFDVSMSGNKLKVHEVKYCDYHGASCTFEGSLKKTE